MSMAVLPLIVGLLIGMTMTGLLARRSGRGEGEVQIGGWEAFLREFERARRYERPFVIARVGGRLTEPAAPGQLPLRRTDQAWSVGHDLYALLPEAGRGDGVRWRERLLAAGTSDDVRIASFPTDGLTTGALLSVLGEAPLVDDHDPTGGRDDLRHIS